MGNPGQELVCERSVMGKVHSFWARIILNGVPRSGKSGIVKVIQESFPGPFVIQNTIVYTLEGMK